MEWWAIVVDGLVAAARHAAGGFVYLFISPGSRVFVGWLAVFVAVTYGLSALHGRKDFLSPMDEGEGGAWWRGLFPRRLWLSSSAKVDYAFFITERLAGFFLFTSAAVSSGVVASFVVENARAGLELGQAPFAPTGLAVAVYTVVSLFMYDVGYFAGHYLGHKVPLLWEFHKFHHVAPVLTPATNFRVHPVDGLVIGAGIALSVGLTDAAFTLLCGPDIRIFELADTNALFLPLFAITSFRHSHVWISFGPTLSKWLSSPCMHQVHHSKDERHWDKNLCQIFSCIDRAAGTLYIPDDKEALEFGVPGYEGKMNRSLIAAYLEPFLGFYRVLRGRDRD